MTTLDQLTHDISLLPQAESNEITNDDFILITDIETNIAKKISIEQLATKINENAVSGSSAFVLIAEKLAVDLGAAPQEELTYIADCNATNTIPVFFVTDKSNGIDNYVNSINEPAISGEGIITVDAGVTNSTGQVATIRVYGDGITLVSSFNLNPGASLTKAQLITQIIFAARDGWNITNPTGDEVHFSEPSGQESQFDGMLLSLESQNNATVNALLVYTAIQNVQGGQLANNINASVNIRRDSLDILQSFNNQLGTLSNQGDSFLLSAPSYRVGNSGNIVIDKDTPMIEQFRVDIYAYGIKLTI